jgi:hypothetical protein
LIVVAWLDFVCGNRGGTRRRRRRRKRKRKWTG